MVDGTVRMQPGAPGAADYSLHMSAMPESVARPGCAFATAQTGGHTITALPSCRWAGSTRQSRFRRHQGGAFAYHSGRKRLGACCPHGSRSQLGKLRLRAGAGSLSSCGASLSRSAGPRLPVATSPLARRNGSGLGRLVKSGPSIVAGHGSGLEAR